MYMSVLHVFNLFSIRPSDTDYEFPTFYSSESICTVIFASKLIAFYLTEPCYPVRQYCWQVQEVNVLLVGCKVVFSVS